MIMRPIPMSVVALLIVGLGTCSVFFSREVESKEATELKERASCQVEEPELERCVRPVPTAVMQVVSDGQIRIFPGKVRANRRAELAFAVSGRLVKLNAQEGTRVQKGQVLARLDQRDFIHAEEAAKARFQQAKRNLDKFSMLREQRVVAETQFEDIKTAYDIALADLNIREKALADTTLRSPFDGVVVDRRVENYGHVKKEEAVLSLQDISGIEVIIQVPERLIARDGTDGLRRLRVLFDADPDKERWYDAVVREYSVESDKGTRTYDVVVALTSPVALNLYPGMTASVSAIVGKNIKDEGRETSATMRVPVEAVWRGVDGGSYVWVVSLQGGHPARRRVEVMALRGDCAEIKSDLKAGTHVAIAGVHALKESALVRPQANGQEGLDG
nr:efflux RND transporter periplasmic adaptor subunit [uncultured Pseudodesulfovibrio sp.]